MQLDHETTGAHHSFLVDTEVIGPATVMSHIAWICAARCRRTTSTRFWLATFPLAALLAAEAKAMTLNFNNIFHLPTETLRHRVRKMSLVFVQPMMLLQSNHQL